MGGNGTIGGGGSVAFDFKIKKAGGGQADPPSQHWRGTDPDAATPGKASTVTVTFNKKPTAGPNNSYTVDVSDKDKDVIVIDWS